MNKLAAKAFAISIGILVFLFGLLLLTTSVVAVVKLHNEINLSLEDFLAGIGILFLFFTGFYFMGISYSMLVLKRISDTSLLILTAIFSFCIAMILDLLIKSFLGKPEDGYGFVLKTLLMASFLTALLISFFFIIKTMTILFRRKI